MLFALNRFMISLFGLQMQHLSSINTHTPCQKLPHPCPQNWKKKKGRVEDSLYLVKIWMKWQSEWMGQLVGDECGWVSRAPILLPRKLIALEFCKAWAKDHFKRTAMVHYQTAICDICLIQAIVFFVQGKLTAWSRTCSGFFEVCYYCFHLVLVAQTYSNYPYFIYLDCPLDLVYRYSIWGSSLWISSSETETSL